MKKIRKKSICFMLAIVILLGNISVFADNTKDVEVKDAKPSLEGTIDEKEQDLVEGEQEGEEPLADEDGEIKPEEEVVKDKGIVESIISDLALDLPDYNIGSNILKSNIWTLKFKVPKVTITKENPIVEFPIGTYVSGLFSEDQNSRDIVINSKKVGSITVVPSPQGAKIVYSIDAEALGGSITVESQDVEVKLNDKTQIETFNISSLDRSWIFTRHDFKVTGSIEELEKSSENNLFFGEHKVDNTSKIDIKISKAVVGEYEIKDIQATIIEGPIYTDTGNTVELKNGKLDIDDGESELNYTFSVRDGSQGSLRLVITDVAGNEKTVNIALGFDERGAKHSVDYKLDYGNDENGYFLKHIVTLNGGKEEDTLPNTITIQESSTIKFPNVGGEDNNFEIASNTGYELDEEAKKYINNNKLTLNKIEDTNTYELSIKLDKVPTSWREYANKHIESIVKVEYKEYADDNDNKFVSKTGRYYFNDPMLVKIPVDSRLEGENRITTWAMIVNNPRKPIGIVEISDEFKKGELSDLKYHIGMNKIPEDKAELAKYINGVKDFADFKSEESTSPHYELVNPADGSKKFAMYFGDNVSKVHLDIKNNKPSHGEGALFVPKSEPVTKDTKYKFNESINAPHYPSFGDGKNTKYTEIPFTDLSTNYGELYQTNNPPIGPNEGARYYKSDEPNNTGKPMLITYEVSNPSNEDPVKNDVTFTYYEKLPTFELKLLPPNGQDEESLTPFPGKLVENQKESQIEDKEGIFKQEKASLIDSLDSTIVHHGILVNVEGAPVKDIEIVDKYKDYYAGLYKEDNIKVLSIDSNTLKRKLRAVEEEPQMRMLIIQMKAEGKSQQLIDSVILKEFIRDNLSELSDEFKKLEKGTDYALELKDGSVEFNLIKEELEEPEEGISYLILLDTYINGSLGSKTNKASIKYDGGVEKEVKDTITVRTGFSKTGVNKDIGDEKRFKITLNLEEFKVSNDVKQFEILDTAEFNDSIPPKYMVFKDIEKVNPDDNFKVELAADNDGNNVFKISKVNSNLQFPKKIEFDYSILFNSGKIFAGTSGGKTITNKAEAIIKYEEPEREVKMNSSANKYFAPGAIASYDEFNIEIEKEVEKGDDLSGFEFSLNWSTQDGDTSIIRSTNEDGFLSFPLTKFKNTYTLTETKRDGYMKLHDILFDATVTGAGTIDAKYSLEFANGALKKDLVEVVKIKDEKGNIVKKFDENSAERISGNYDIADDHTIVLRIVNKIDLRDISFKKVDDRGDALSGAEFKLQKYNSNTNRYEDYKSMVSKSDSNGLVIFNDLENGKYRIAETKAPDGYILSRDYIEFELNKFDDIDVKLENVINKKVIIPTIPPTEPEIQEPSEPVEPDLAPIPELNKKDHFAYMIGYPDGFFKPNGNIKRSEVTTIFFRMLTDDARNQYWSTVNNFKDVNEKSWYNNAVSTMANANIIDKETINFRPNENMTRAELAVMMSKFFNEVGTKTHNFTDINGHWAEKEIARVAAKGWIDGYPDKTFRPDEPLTRAETAKLVNALLERNPDRDKLLDNMIKWPDNSDKDKWYYEDVQEATNSHEYTRKDVKSKETWTRLLPVRDWAALEKEWSRANSSANPGDVKK